MRRIREQTWVRVYRADAAVVQGGRCFYCATMLGPMTGDHVKPRSTGGATVRTNIKAACADCNVAKGSMSAGAFLRSIKHPEHGGPFSHWLAFMRRKIWVRTHRACERIERMVS